MKSDGEQPSTVEPTAGPGATANERAHDDAAHPFLSRKFGNQVVTRRRRPEADLAIFDFGVTASARRRIIVTKLDHLGDFLMALPALEKLRRAFPDDHITLVCGPWNVDFARATGLVDEIRVYRFFPEDASRWNGEPIEGTDAFRRVTRGSFDIAIDLRVDEDTRALLQHIDARMKCGIGSRGRHAFLDLILPAAFERREIDPLSLQLGPERFQSRMPVQTPVFHETDFSASGHVIFGPDLALPAGRFRVVWNLQPRSPLGSLPGVKIAIDVARNRGEQIIAGRQIVCNRHADPATWALLEFENDANGAEHEFRLHVSGRSPWGRLRFFGLSVERIDRERMAHFAHAELHVGEQLSLLVQLIEERTRRIDISGRLPGSRTEADDHPGTFTWPAAAKRVIIAPLSNSRLRDWGLDKYARLAARLLQRIDCAIVLVGAPGQREALARLAQHNRIINLAGRLEWLQTAAVVRDADLVISNNSGIGHLAAACGTPSLAIYSGSHQPQEWGPRGNGSRAIMALVPCSPCGHDRLEACPNDHLCMRLITPEAVADEAEAMLSCHASARS